jgi:acylphosphatase
MQKRVNIIVKGLVQGVGYRYFTYKKASEFDLKGYVKNLTDGSVEVGVEGEDNMIHDFVRDLKIGPFNSKVNSLIIEEFPSKKEFSDFMIY